MMKQTLILGMALLLAVAAFAQKNVTQFLGIPVDGTKSAMIQKLKAKGYTYDASSDLLSGQFNGRSVYVKIATNNNKVYRIVVTDANTSSETDIRIRFNTLCDQFSKNEKYMPADFLGEYKISEDADISYEMSVKNKRYEASYFQVSKADQDTSGFTQWAVNRILEKYGDEGWESMDDKDRETALLTMAVLFMVEKIQHKSVWFMISRFYGKYSIVIYYDNELNKAHGEDL